MRWNFILQHYFSPLNTSMRKGKDPDPDPYLWLMDPDPGGPKTSGSGSGYPTLLTERSLFYCIKKYRKKYLLCTIVCWGSLPLHTQQCSRVRYLSGTRVQVANNFCSVADPKLFWPWIRDPGWVKRKVRIRDPGWTSRIHFRKLRNNFVGEKILKFFDVDSGSCIRNLFDPGSATLPSKNAPRSISVMLWNTVPVCNIVILIPYKI